MEALWFLIAIASIGLIAWGIDLFMHREPLAADELVQLAEKRQRNAALSEYSFSMLSHLASPSEKKAMKARGEFVKCDLEFFDAPVRVAGLLKYKKHEWIVIALISAKKVGYLWWNKGPDGTQVYSLIDHQTLKSVIETLQIDSIAILHNHPNPNPSRYTTSQPSERDLQTAEKEQEALGAIGISVLHFVCERGMPYLYYAGFTPTLVPIAPILSEIDLANGVSILGNYSLRKELKRKTLAEQIAGGLSCERSPELDTIVFK